MNMREKIARAIGRGLDVADPLVGNVVEESELFAAAGAVLDAMREPTEEMVQRRIDSYPHELRIRHYDLEVWRTMIDAAKDTRHD